MSSPTINPTRQQLEELDALLQRMLSLPLNQLDAELLERFQTGAQPLLDHDADDDLSDVNEELDPDPEE